MAFQFRHIKELFRAGFKSCVFRQCQLLSLTRSYTVSVSPTPGSQGKQAIPGRTRTPSSRQATTDPSGSLNSHTEAGREQLSLRDTTFNTTAGSFRSCVHTQTSGLSFYPFMHRRDKRYKSRCWDPLLRGMGANQIPFPPVGRGEAVKRGPSYFRPAVPRSYFSIRLLLYI